MNEPVQVGLIGFSIGGGAIGFGGLIAYAVNQVQHKWIPLVMTTSAAMALVVLLVELLPASIRNGGILITLLGAILGYYIVKKIEKWSQSVIIITNHAQKDLFFRSALLLAPAIAIHNFPSGLALGSSLIKQPELAADLSIAIAIHSLPEGLLLGLPLVLSKIRPTVILLIVCIIGIPAGLGAMLGYQFGGIFPKAFSFILGMALSTIIYVVCIEIFQFAWKESGIRTKTIGILTGIILGLLFISTF